MVSALSLKHRGFTLIELLVVTIVIGLILATAGLNLGSNDRDKLHDEVRRFSLLLQSAQEEAILQGVVILVGLDAEGYIFFQPDETGKPAEMNQDEIFRSRQLPDGIKISHSEIDGVAVTEKPFLIFFPTGETIPFVITFRVHNLRWLVTGKASGEIQVPETPEAEA